MIGQRVRLASGGPEMLVTDIDAANWKVLCSWPSGEEWFNIWTVDVIRRHWLLDDWLLGGDD